MFKVCDFYFGSTWHHSEMMTFRLKKDIQTYFDSSIESDSLQGTDTNLQYQFDLKPLERNITAKTGDDQSDLVKFSVVGFSLKLQRYYQQHIVSYYIPSLIFVMGSWISFVIPPGAIPGRMAMLITLLLVSINLFGTIIRIQPASRTTLLSIWTFACTIFVALALFAYAMALGKRWSQQADKVSSNITRVKPMAMKTEHTSDKDEMVLNGTPNSNWDRNCLIVFPLVFLLFNCIYWPIVVAQNLAVK